MTEASEQQISSLNNSRMEFAHFSVKRNGTLTPMQRDIAAEELATARSSAQKNTLHELPNNTQGLNMQRIQASLDLFDAPQKPMRFLESSDFTAALEQSGHRSSEPSGIYIESLETTLIKRDLALEALNGIALTESLAVHEGAHSTHVKTPLRLIHSKYGIWRHPEISIHPSPRVHGMSPQDLLTPYLGNMFEEGYAELERGIFVQTHNLTEQFTHNAVNFDQIADSPLPLHYMYRIPSSSESDNTPSLTFVPGVIGATIFEILIKQNEQLLPTLRKSRHDIEGVRQTAELIDTIMPGLYAELQPADKEKMTTILVEVLKEFK